MTVKIVTDSTSDLPQELIEEFGITVVPAYVQFGGKTYRDGVDISQDEIYHKMVNDNIIIKTSQPPPGDFIAVYKKLLEEANEIISLQVTSKLSGIYNSAVQAKEMIGAGKRIEVVDSMSTSMGLGLTTLSAARMAQAGDGMIEIMEEIKSSLARTHLWGIFDTLKYLLLGGRIGKAKALLGGMLRVKPMLTMSNGELQPTGLARSRSKGLDKLFEHVKNYLNIQDVAIVHSTTPEDAQSLKERIGTIFDKNNIHISRLGPALGVHGGPGTLILTLREKVSDLTEKGETEKKRTISLPSFPSVHLPKMKFASP
ncbi:MAG: DegV family protein [Dehalococcoidales bacterium]|jgi:DegV family protein with EDD domain|nr:DegV family protein [Dehalococcoidales bacterium]NLT27720.1 DegV family protein [Dehalococcoidales bacterium]